MNKEDKKEQNKIDDQYLFRFHQYEYNKAIDYFDEALKIAISKNNVTIESIMSKSRTRENVMARSCIFKFMRENTKASLKWIGERFTTFGGKPKDHATVLHGVRQLNDLMEFDQFIYNEYRSFENLCKISISKRYEQKYGKAEKVFADHPEMEFVAHHRNNVYKRIIFSGYTQQEIAAMLNQFGEFHEEYKLEQFSTTGLIILKL